MYKKPFAIPELVVRMKTLLERSGKRILDPEKGQESYSIGEYLFTPESATLLHKPTGEATLIPRREADILQLLCKGSGSIIPTQNILLSLWGDDDFFNARSLVHSLANDIFELVFSYSNFHISTFFYKYHFSNGNVVYLCIWHNQLRKEFRKFILK